ncbi:MAG TPA: EAL domain-containing protein, partial [Telluria sp.]|nr:EAL domain-containing protein [Telluria sp.]
AEAFIAEVAGRLRGAVRDEDVPARFGGGEFALLLRSVGDAAQASAACAAIGAALAEPVHVDGRPVTCDFTTGITLYPRDAGDARDAGTLLRHAQMALEGARMQGVGSHHFYSAQLSERARERERTVAALRQGLARGEFELAYQPAADLRTGQITSLEALLRWRHPERGLLPAGKFIAIAEDAGLTGALGDWVMRRALQDLHDWKEAGLPALRVSVNMWPRQLHDTTLAARISALLAEFEVDPALFALEVRESAIGDDDAGAAQVLAAVRQLGVGLVLDDFGTGMSSLNHLKHLPADLIKIDASLIANIVGDPRSAAMCKTIVAMAHHLGIEVAAEGVETEQQCDFLRLQMCDQIQGHFFAGALDAPAIGAMLADGHALPAHLLRIQARKRTLLLVDDEPNILSALKRLLRRDDYRTLTAGSGQEALAILEREEVDVIVSDQRMPGMLGSEFLHVAKSLYPNTLRIMLSGYTELQSVTNAVNEGAIYKFLTKPWDDDLLRGHIADAFRLKEISDENQRLNLELRTAIHDLATANRKLEVLLQKQQKQIHVNEVSLHVARELLQSIPMPVLGVDDDGMIAFVNAAAGALFGAGLLGSDAHAVLPVLFDGPRPSATQGNVIIFDRPYHATIHSMGEQSSSRGTLVMLAAIGDSHADAPLRGGTSRNEPN